MIDRLRFHHF